MTCTHSRYREPPYMPVKEAWSALRATNAICYIGMVERVCADCGGDISHERLVRTMTVKEYMAGQAC